MTGGHEQLVDAAAFAASVSDCPLETRIEPKYRGYRFRDDEMPIRLAVDALARAGYSARLGLSGGAADANVFNARGLPCVNLANGMTDIHTPDERIAVAELHRLRVDEHDVPLLDRAGQSRVGDAALFVDLETDEAVEALADGGHRPPAQADRHQASRATSTSASVTSTIRSRSATAIRSSGVWMSVIPFARLTHGSPRALNTFASAASPESP